jgi:hypothetical protein
MICARQIICACASFDYNMVQGDAMAESKSVCDPIPEHFSSIKEAAEFWDTHDLTDYWDLTEDVNFEVDLQRRRYLVSLDPDLAKKLSEEAHVRGLSTETLVNLWLSDKLKEVAA